jgi:tetratricopeptide (TPR) repeat protein
MERNEPVQQIRALVVAAALLATGCAGFSPQLKQGNQAFYNRQWDRAILLFDEAERMNSSKDSPDFISLHSNRSIAYSRKGMHEQALKDADLLVQAYPKNGFIQFTRGEVLSRMGRNEEAMAACEEGIKLAHPLWKYSTFKARILLRAGRVAEGIAEFGDCIKKSYAYSYSLFDMGETLDEVGMKADAVAAYKAALGLEDDTGEKIAVAYVTREFLDYLQGMNTAGPGKLPNMLEAIARQRIAALENELREE